MSYFAHSVRDHILGRIHHQADKVLLGLKMIFMVPAMDEKPTLAVAEAVSGGCLKDARLHLILKIAATLTGSWSPEGQQQVEEKGWMDERGNLTYYRNTPGTPEQCTVIVLFGADRVTDAAGLADFHTCDPDLIWRADMRQSFRPWVEKKLHQTGLNGECREDDFAAIDRVITPLLTCGRGDLLQISSWLERLNLNSAIDVTDVPRIMLGSLDRFGLPRLSRFPLRQKRKSLVPYINKSSEFFSYTLFLEPRRRDKGIKAVDDLLRVINDGEITDIPLDEEEIRGPYASGEEFLSGLKNFIENEDQAEGSRLLQCDFVVIWDQILKFKTQKKKEKRERVRKLAGGPVEVFLDACWQTLRDFCLEHTNETELKIDSLSIRTDLFKHDIESGEDDDGGDIAESAELAARYLSRLLGGMDIFVSQHLNLANADGSDIGITSELLHDEIAYRYAKSAEPVLEFSVIVVSPLSSSPLRRRFGWRLPEHHTYRLALELLKLFRKGMKALPEMHRLPVYHVPYFDELLLTASDDETRRVLLHAVRDERETEQVITNLLSGEWGKMADPLSNKLKALTDKYAVFIDKAATDGIWATLFSPNSYTWPDLRKAYTGIFDEVAKLDDIGQSSLAGMLTRAFLIIRQRPASLGDTWHADYHEPFGVATILHPSVVEMLEAQAIYLSRCFNCAANKDLAGTPEKKSFAPHIWKTFADLAVIQSPLVGLLGNEQHNLDAMVRGKDLIHRLGEPKSFDTPLSTRLLLQYSDSTGDETELSDTELFRETSESRLLARLLLDYFDLHPHARDGIHLAVFRNRDVQPVVAAVYSYLKILAKKPTKQKPNTRYALREDQSRPYAISVTLFTESNDEVDVAAWVQQWKERWEAAESESKYSLYKLCRFSVAHRIIEIEGRRETFQKLINEQFEADLAVFYNFIGIGTGVNSFEKVEPFDVTSRELKFPILEKASCTINNPAEKYRRKRVVSNRQFVLSARHANLLHSLQSGIPQTGTIVVGSSDFTPWRGLMDALHRKVEWVVCIDPSIDERLIKSPLAESGKEREIIGFGSGVGTHGENNYTISTESFSFNDIHYRLTAAIKSLYGAGAGWNNDECEAVAKGILAIAPELSGLSLVRATGVGDEYIREFIAYTLSRKMLRAADGVLCESLISLDAYRHWFDLSEDRRRPDLMWMRVELGEEKRLQVRLRLIECKLGYESEEYVYKAKTQINNGLRVLVAAFAPLPKDGGAGIEDDHPDRRYWWMQLHRLIASKTEVNKQQYPAVLTALERLAEGDFDVSWDASVFTFWINKDTDIKHENYWVTETAGQTVVANTYSIGGGFVLGLATNPDGGSVDWEALNNQGGKLLDDNEFIPPEIDRDDPIDNEDDFSDEETGNGLDEPLEPATMPSPPPPASPGRIVPETTPMPPTVEEPGEREAVDSGQPKQAKTIEVEPDTALGRILLGNTLNNDQPVYWEFSHPKLVNRHLLIFGSSGQGKTYAIQCILCEMSRFRQNSLVVDYTNGFLPNQLEPATNAVLSPEQHVVRNKPLPINPFLPQVSDNGGIVWKENANDIAKRIAGLFVSVYDIGTQQYSILHRAIMDGVETLNSEMNLDRMLDLIEDMTEDKRFKAAAQTLHSKLRPFVLDKPFSSGNEGLDWDHLFDKVDPLCNIFQLTGMDMYSGRLITEFILWDLYGYLQSKGKKTDPKVVVLDEVQNLDHKEGSPLSKYLREGRKFGLSLILATQTMSNMKKDERDRMFQAEHKLFFKPADTELKAFAEIAALATRQKTDEWIRRLATLGKGECFSIGQAQAPDGERLVSRALKIRITAMKERSFNE